MIPVPRHSFAGPRIEAEIPEKNPEIQDF